MYKHFFFFFKQTYVHKDTGPIHKYTNHFLVKVKRSDINFAATDSQFFDVNTCDDNMRKIRVN